MSLSVWQDILEAACGDGQEEDERCLGFGER